MAGLTRGRGGTVGPPRASGVLLPYPSSSGSAPVAVVLPLSRGHASSDSAIESQRPAGHVLTELLRGPGHSEPWGPSACANLRVLLGPFCTQPLAFGCRAWVTVLGLVTF